MNRTVKFMMRTAIALILAALGCLISFSAIGSSVAEDGRLVEPFFLIPIAWLLFLSGGMLAIATFIIRRSKARSTT
jgi:hypothetical protein